MKLNKILVAGASLLAITAVAPQQAGAVDATGDINAVIMQTLSVQEVNSLHFGGISPHPDTAGSVTVDTDGTATPTEVQLIDDTLAGAAQFTISGEPGYFVMVEFEDESEILTSVDTEQTMTVDEFLVAGPTEGPAETIVENLNIGGVIDINVGATLAVGAAQAAGNYEGAFVVNVVYQ